jgi:hypothetical protein
MSVDDEDNEALQAMRQKLMTADEVYIYKSPPLKTAGGHRCVVLCALLLCLVTAACCMQFCILCCFDSHTFLMIYVALQSGKLEFSPTLADVQSLD